MYGMFLKFASWLLQKLAVAALIVALGLAAYGGWVYLQEEGILEKQRVERIQQAITNRDNLLAAEAAIEKQIAGIRGDIEKQKERLKQAEKVVATLRELEDWWARWWPWSDRKTQQSANAEQLKKMEDLKTEAGSKWTALQKSMTGVIEQKGEIGKAILRTNEEISQLEASRSRARHYVVLAWEKTKWLILIALLSYFFGPTLWSLAMYYVVAPFMSRGRPIQLGPDPSALPEVGESHVSVEAVLRPGEVLRIREKYLQASDEGLGKRTRFVLDWRIPFTSAAAGLVELVEMRHPLKWHGHLARDPSHGHPVRRAEGPEPVEGDAHATPNPTGETPVPRPEYRVTLSNGDDPHIELAEVNVPAGGSLVLRPTFLAGVLQRDGDRLQIRRHWRIFRWQSWVCGQFRFFEFVGPCRLFLAGSRGVRAERLAEREGVSSPARRTNQDATIGFSPNLAYRPVRAETFWSYYRGMNPLFDDLFSGRGVFVLQETASEGGAAKAGRFWSNVWSGVLKVFGL
jgi:hypothetical protein